MNKPSPTIADNIRKKYAALCCASEGNVEVDVNDLRYLMQAAGVIETPEEPTVFGYATSMVSFTAANISIAKHVVAISHGYACVFWPLKTPEDTYVPYLLDRRQMKLNRTLIREALLSFKPDDDSNFTQQNIVTNAKELARFLQ